MDREREAACLRLEVSVCVQLPKRRTGNPAPPPPHITRSLAQLCLSSVSLEEGGDCGGSDREAKCSSLDVRGSLSDVVVDDCRSRSFLEAKNNSGSVFSDEIFTERCGRRSGLHSNS